MAYPGFPRGGGANSPGGDANIRFYQILSKTAWNWKNLDGGASLMAPLDPPLHTLRPVQMFTIQDPDFYSTDIWWLLKHTVAASRRYSQTRSIMSFCYRPQWSCGKVMFSQVCVKNSVQGGIRGRGQVWHGKGVCMARTCPPRQILRDMVNEWAVGILLECIFVLDMNSNTSVLGWQYNQSYYLFNQCSIICRPP